MLATIGNTWQLLKISWRVLEEDTELAWFPVMSGIALLFVFGYMGFAFFDLGTFDRLSRGGSISLLDVGLMLIGYISVSFVVIYFNAALIAAAHQRLKGEDPSVRSGLSAANQHLGSIFGWAVIAGTVAFVLQQISDNRGLAGKIVAALLSTLWAYVTFFVVPLMVIEGVGPVEAMHRSTELFNKTWGKQMVSNAGFGLAYTALALAAMLPGVLLLLTADTTQAIAVGLAMGLPVFLMGLAVLKTMEGIFTAALFGYATGSGTGGHFPEHMLRYAYVDKANRGSWSNALRYPDAPSQPAPSFINEEAA